VFLSSASLAILWNERSHDIIRSQCAYEISMVVLYEIFLCLLWEWEQLFFPISAFSYAI
jgi:hypothetical protein